ncbi:ABC-2 type transport system permease protein [Nocardioides alpinus]|uniref:ABC transporter permease n=1 Tax=Nocardioides alpinus TaxID=748909 RepID=A0A1I1ABC3_9ACTN|nr:ABC transporter permease [Nocardioides alpinus]PKH43432.1 ABC transporter permease [Nocardioides alpinus]SFB34656.1 ABC-2 type transport system permease protein [Nocardioides alpinus]
MSTDQSPDHSPDRSTGTAEPAWLLVTRREVVSRITDKSFLIGTLLMVVMLVGFIGFTAWQDERTDEVTLGATPDAVAMATVVQEAAPEVDDKVQVTVVELDDAEAAETALTEDEVDAWLHPVDGGWELTSESSEQESLTSVVEAVVRQQVLAENASGAGTTVEELEAGSAVTTAFLRGDAERAAVAEAVGFVFVFLFYFAALIFGMQLASSVIEEKQSRIVEIIAAAIPLRHLLAGKVLGNTALAVIQLLIYLVVGLIGLSFTSYKSYVPALTGPTAWFIGFFLAGFIALACLWAVAGSLASRTEDLQATSTPLTMLMLAMFFGGLSLDGRSQVIASYIPPVSAVVMPKRILAGGVEWWEPLLALGLLAGFAVVTVWVGERLYRRALLQTGGRVSLRQAWSAAE